MLPCDYHSCSVEGDDAEWSRLSERVFMQIFPSHTSICLQWVWTHWFFYSFFFCPPRLRPRFACVTAFFWFLSASSLQALSKTTVTWMITWIKSDSFNDEVFSGRQFFTTTEKCLSCVPTDSDMIFARLMGWSVLEWIMKPTDGIIWNQWWQTLNDKGWT